MDSVIDPCGMETIIVAISEEQAGRLLARISAGQYGSLDEIVREALYIWEAVRAAATKPDAPTAPGSGKAP
jgi:Arc/MetJ-type ribon-helix-helix transcriptional regulator